MTALAFRAPAARFEAPPFGSRLWLRDQLENREITLAGKDGGAYVVRPIRLSDAPSLMRGYDAMTDHAKWFRMLHAVPHLSEDMAQKFCTPDPEHDLCVVVEGTGALHGDILGGARFTGGDDRLWGEFSVSLRPEGQGLGLGRQALELALAAGLQMGYRQVWGSVHSENAPMMALARRLNFGLRRDPQDPALMLAEREL